jgi:hypothetical protein
VSCYVPRWIVSRSVVKIRGIYRYEGSRVCEEREDPNVWVDVDSDDSHETSGKEGFINEGSVSGRCIWRND